MLFARISRARQAARESVCVCSACDAQLLGNLSHIAFLSKQGYVQQHVARRLRITTAVKLRLSVSVEQLGSHEVVLSVPPGKQKQVRSHVGI